MAAAAAVRQWQHGGKGGSAAAAAAVAAAWWQWRQLGRSLTAVQQRRWQRGSGSSSVAVVAAVAAVCVGSYKLPLGQYTFTGQMVACSFQQKYDFSQLLLVWPADILPSPAPSIIYVVGVLLGASTSGSL